MSPNIIGETLLNQYRIEAFIDKGGMGAVYRVWDLKMNVPLAMKVLHSELAEDPSMFKRFQREANALKKLAHPNIVPFYGLYQTLDFVFLLERFIDGPSLKDILKQRQGKPLPVSEALVYLKALCAALGYAHVKGVVHCDVKPGNVMVDRGGSIYLTDFGIARHSESTTTTMGTAGTPAYMAPEQIRGEVVTPATDIYALGVVLYEMLAGQRPFRGNEAGTEKGGTTVNERIRYGHLKILPLDPANLNPDISGELSKVILKALEKNSVRRYKDAQEFFKAVCLAVGADIGDISERVVSQIQLEQIRLAKSATYVPDASEIVGQIKTPVHSTQIRILIPLLVFIGLLMFGGLVILYVKPLNELQATPNPTPIQNQTNYSIILTPVISVSTSTNTPSMILPTVINTPTPNPSPTQTITTLPSIGGADLIAFLNANDIWVMGVDGSNLSQITKDGSEKKDLQWSPERQNLFYISGKCIYSVSYPDGVTTQVTCFSSANFVEAFEVSRDGTQVAISVNRIVYVVPFNLTAISNARESDQLRAMKGCFTYGPPNQGLSMDVSWSNDGKWLAIKTKVPLGDILVDEIHMYDISDCPIANVYAKDSIPASRFLMLNYPANPDIPSFSWDGGLLILLNSMTRYDFGYLYEYNMGTKRARRIDPLGTSCCYTQARFSPDGTYLLLAYQNFGEGPNAKTEMYYISYGNIGTGILYKPLILPEDFFSSPKDHLDAVLRSSTH
jgi:serine/threonine protein kinase